MNSGFLEAKAMQDEQSMLNQLDAVKLSTAETREQLELVRARDLKEQGKLDDAMVVCRDLLVSGGKRGPEQRWFQEAKSLFEEIVTESRRSRDNLGPHSLLDSVLRLSAIEDRQKLLEHLKLLAQHANNSETADSLIKSEKFPLALKRAEELLSSSKDDELQSLYLTFFGNIISSASVSALKSFDFISNINSSSKIFSKLDSSVVSLFVKIPVTFCQRVYLREDTIPYNTHEFINEIIRKLLDSCDKDLNDIAFSSMLKLWNRPEFCRDWIDNQIALKTIITKFFYLQEDGKLKDGHLAMVLNFLNDAADQLEKDFSACAMNVYNAFFESDRKHAIQLLTIMFSGVNELAAKIFNQAKVIGDLVDLVDIEPAETQILIMELFAEACGNKSAREVMRGNLMSFLKSTCANGTLQPKLKALASLVLCKLSCADVGKTETSDTTAVDHRVLAKNLLENIMKSDVDVSESGTFIEGLAYLSTRPIVKEVLETQAKQWMPKLEPILKKCDSYNDSGVSGAIQYGVAVILDSLCSYKRKKSKEEEQVQKLKEYAKEVIPEENDPRESDSAVEKRIRTLVDSGMLKLLVKLSSNESSRVTELVARSWNHCARDPSIRGKLAQEGAIKSLLNIYNNDPDHSKSLVGDENHYPFIYAANAISLIAISLDPHVAYPNTAANLIKPLISIMKSENGLYQFESLLALTNLAGMDESKVGEVAGSIRKKLSDKPAFRIIEDLILSDHPKIQCAAVELLCNLMSDNQCRSNWISYRGETRTKILLALTDAEELATRKAASACLAMLVYDKEPRNYLKSFDNTVPTILALMTDGDIEILWRAVFLLTGICSDAESTITFLKKASTEQLNVLAHALIKASQASHPQVAQMARALLEQLTAMGLLKL